MRKSKLFFEFSIISLNEVEEGKTMEYKFEEDKTKLKELIMKNTENKLAIYQSPDGEIILREDFDNETFWASQKQISQIFEVNSQAITKHIKNIYQDEELEVLATCSKMEQVQKEGNRYVSRNIEFYNLDMIISIGYRVNSIKATNFRKWATKTLKDHITQGFTVNKKVVKKNKEKFLEVISDLQLLSKNNSQLSSKNILDLIENFSETWFSLESYDKQIFPKSTKKIKNILDISIADILYKEIEILKNTLIEKQEATDLFAQEKIEGALKGILGNVFQSAFGDDLYATPEEKAAHLLYFIIKNHVFNDGNKRTGAFVFIWFLQKIKYSFEKKISPETLTALTLLIAESNPKDKEKMIGIVLLLLADYK